MPEQLASYISTDKADIILKQSIYRTEIFFFFFYFLTSVIINKN